MNELALPVRTHLHSHEATFHDLMAEHLRRAPWFLLSATAHAFALLVLWLLMPVTVPPPTRNSVTMAPPIDLPVIQPLPAVQKPLVSPEPTLVEPVTTPTEAQEDHPDVNAPADANHDAATLSAFDSIGNNPAVGIGGNAGGQSRKGRGNRGGDCTPPCAAIDRALEWLARHQDADGRWDCDGFMKHDVEGEPCNGPGNAVHDVSVTGLALLAFLGDGHTLRSGRYRDQVRNAVRWLREQQDPASGRFGQANSSDFMYDHAIATYAMCEAQGMSEYTTLQPTAQRAIDYLQASRNPYGAWRYQPRDGDNDTSVTAWCIMALCTADHWGLTIDRNALRIASTFLESCTSSDGHCGYQKPGQPGARKPGDHGERFPPSRTDALTAAGLLCRFFLGQDPKTTPVMQQATNRLLARRPVADPKSGAIDHYYWYYGSYALFQAGGKAWQEWSKALDAAVVKSQCTKGNTSGSWDPIDVWGEDGGRVYSTAMLALTLEAYYRYTRLVR